MPQVFRFTYSATFIQLRNFRNTEERNIVINFKRKYPVYGTKFITYAKRAYSKGMRFSLTIQDFIALDVLSCHYCGGKPTGYDRYDNKIGYIKSNIIPCCPKCNMMKFDHSHKDFMDQIRKIYKYTFNKR